MGDLLGRLIAFDLDGTLIDSRRDLANAANALIVELGGRPLQEEAIGRMVGEGAPVLVERALRAAGLLGDEAGGLPAKAGSYIYIGSDAGSAGSYTGGAGSDAGTDAGSYRDSVASAFRRKALERFLTLYDERLLDHTVAYDGIPEALEAARRHARLAVLTNKPVHATERVLTGLGLRTAFDDVIGADSAWPRKPDPSSLKALMVRAGATPRRTLLVGDSAIDHETAARVGARCCLATYGFGYETFPADRLTGAEWIVRTPGELPALFEAFTAAS